MRDVLSFRIDSAGRPDCDKRDPAVEAECGDLLRLLGQGGHGLQRVHAGLPLEPCKNFPSQDHRIPRYEEQARQASLFGHG